MTTIVHQGDLLEPILKNLLTQGADTLHPFMEVANQTLASMSLTLDCMGEKNGRPLVLIPFSNAGFGLRGRGLIEREGRSWKLTTLGVEVAEGKTPMPKMPAQAAKAPKEPKPPKAPKAPKEPKPPKAQKAPKEPKPPKAQKAAKVAPVATPEASASAPEVAETPEEIGERLAEAAATPDKPKEKQTSVVVVSVPETDAPEWVRDPYLRGLVASNTPCYGSWAPKVTPCVACPLSGYCRSAQAGALSILATKLKEVDVKKETAKLHTLTATAMSPTATRANANPVDGKSMRASFDGICARSGNPIKAGDECYYVPGEGVVSADAFTANAASA